MAEETLQQEKRVVEWKKRVLGYLFDNFHILWITWL
jgi:hypothetical protein